MHDAFASKSMLHNQAATTLLTDMTFTVMDQLPYAHVERLQIVFHHTAK